MPGTELRPQRRAQTTGVSKQRKKHSNGNLKRQLITIKAIINNPQVQLKAPEDCLTISRQCSASPAPRPTVQQALHTTGPPPHVVLFFDHINGTSATQRSHEEAARYCRSLDHDMAVARTKLQSLLISKEDVARASEHASRWMSIYHGLYSLTYTFRTGFQLVALYERMHSPDAHPVLLASYILCLAISLQHAPSQLMVGEVPRSEYVLQVCDVVEEVVVRKNILAGTVEGLETCMLLLMLAVGRNDLTTICVTLKRIVTLAELMGLPQAGYARATTENPSRDDPYHEAKLRTWEAICATDRNFGMMLKLPASTTSSIFPLHKLLWRESGNISQSYNYYLARICGMIIAIDKSFTNDDPEAESYKMVSIVDRALKTLASHVPAAWLTTDSGRTEDLIVRFWHHYITSRAHLRPAMIQKDEYESSRTAVRTSSVDALRMFCGFRTSLPRGFFYCRVLDIQAFTSAILLLLFRNGSDRNTIHQQDEMINRVVGTFKVVSAEGASSFARKAVQQISALQDFIHGGPASTMTVHIPLLGNIRIESISTPTAERFANVGFNPFGIEEHTSTFEDSSISLDSNIRDSSRQITFSIDFENDSPWTPPASRAGGYGRD